MTFKRVGLVKSHGGYSTVAKFRSLACEFTMTVFYLRGGYSTCVAGILLSWRYLHGGTCVAGILFVCPVFYLPGGYSTYATWGKRLCVININFDVVLIFSVIFLC